MGKRRNSFISIEKRAVHLMHPYRSLSKNGIKSFINIILVHQYVLHPSNISLYYVHYAPYPKKYISDWNPKNMKIRHGQILIPLNIRILK